MALYLPSPPLKLPPALLVPRVPSRTPPSSPLARRCPSVSHLPRRFPGHRRRGGLPVLASVGKEETDVRVSEEDQSDVSPEDLECVREIQRVLELLKKNRDMIFGEVKLTIMIEDPRDVERKRLLGIDDTEDITRDDLVIALEDVNEGRIPKNRVALKLLAKEMTEWPNLEVESLEKGRPRKSLYAKATDTGVDPQAAKRLNIDWDSAVDIDTEDEDGDDIDVPPAVMQTANCWWSSDSLINASKKIRKELNMYLPSTSAPSFTSIDIHPCANFHRKTWHVSSNTISYCAFSSKVNCLIILGHSDSDYDTQTAT